MDADDVSYRSDVHSVPDSTWMDSAVCDQVTMASGSTGRSVVLSKDSCHLQYVIADPFPVLTNICSITIGG